MTTVEFTFTPIDPSGKTRMWRETYRFRLVARLMAWVDSHTTLAGWTTGRVLPE